MLSDLLDTVCVPFSETDQKIGVFSQVRPTRICGFVVYTSCILVGIKGTDFLLQVVCTCSGVHHLNAPKLPN